jgi:hypothetical protein
MKIKDIFNIENIAHYIEGNAKFYYDKLIGEPQYLREQRIWRLYMCKDDCVISGKCKKCRCPTEKKVFQDDSCNEGEIFPDIMDNIKWEQYKKDNNIDGEELLNRES